MSFSKGVLLTAAASGVTLFYLAPVERTSFGPQSPLISAPVIVKPLAKAAAPKPITPSAAPIAASKKVAPKKVAKISKAKTKSKAPYIRAQKKVFATPPLVLAPAPIIDDEKPLNELVDRELESDPNAEETESALNTSDPLQMLAELALREPSLLEATPAMVSESQLDPEFQMASEGLTLSKEERIGEQLSSLHKNDFAEIRVGLDAARAELPEFAQIAAPALTEFSKGPAEAELTSAPVTPEKNKLAPNQADTNILTRAPVKPPIVTALPKVAVAAPVAVPTPSPVAVVEAAPVRAFDAAAELADAPATSVVEQIAPSVSTQTADTSPALSLGPVLASAALAAPAALTTQATAITQSIPTAMATTPIQAVTSVASSISQAMPTLTGRNLEQPSSTKPVVLPSARTVAPTTAAPVVRTAAGPAVVTETVTPAQVNPEEFGETLQVNLDYDNDLDQFLKEQRGHVQVYLQPVGPQARVYLSCETPRDCSVDAHAMVGTYHLVAVVHTARISTAATSAPETIAPTTEAYGHIVHGKEISAGNAKSHIIFKLEMRNVVKSEPNLTNESGRIPLVGIIYQAVLGGVTEPTLAPEDESRFQGKTYLLPKSVASCEVQIVGFPRLGTRTCEADGTVRFASVPARSQFLLKVTASGFLPAFIPVAVFNGLGSVKAYLLNNERIANIAEQLGFPLMLGRSFLFGRLFDSTSHSAAKDQAVSLTQRRGKSTIYLNPEPNKTAPGTSDNGAFGWINLGDSNVNEAPENRLGMYRSIERGPGKLPYPVFVRPASGYFHEFGRAVERSFYGEITDAFDNVPVSALVRVMDDKDPHNSVLANASGKFRTPKNDFAAGKVSLEFEADKYPTTISVQSYDPESRPRVFKIPMIKKARLDDGLVKAGNHAGVRYENEMGKLLVGVGDFPKSKCIQPVLYRINGMGVQEEVPLASGPYPFEDENVTPHKRLCLQPGRWAGFMNLPESEYALALMDENGREVRGQLVDVRKKRLSTVLVWPSKKTAPGSPQPAAPDSLPENLNDAQ